MRPRSNATTGAMPAHLTCAVTVSTTSLPSRAPGPSLLLLGNLKENVPSLPIAPPVFDPDTPFFESNLASSDNLPTATGFKPPFVPRQQRRLRCKKAKGLKIAPPIFEEGVYEVGDGSEFGGLETEVQKVEVARDLCTGLLRIGEVLQDRESVERVAQEERVWWVADSATEVENEKAEKKDMGEHWEEYFTGW